MVPVPAPASRRLGAAAINGVVGVGAVLGAGAGFAWGWRRRAGDDRPGMPLAPWRTPSGRWQVAIAAANIASAVLMRNRRSPGMRALGLRVVDARTGGPVSARQALVLVTVDEALRLATRRRPSRGEAAGGTAPRAAHAEHGSGCGRALVPLVPTIALSQAPALRPPRHQTLAQRLAGVMVADDRPRGA